MLLLIMTQHTNNTNKLHLNPRMFQPLPILRPNSNSTLDTLTIHIQRCLFAFPLVKLHVDHLSFVCVFEDDIDVYGGAEEERHG